MLDGGPAAPVSAGLRSRLEAGPAGGQGTDVARRIGRAAAHPRRSASRVADRLPLPVSALLDLPLLRHALRDARGAVLVLGDRRVVVRALPTGACAVVDAAGTDPHDTGVTVVSPADGPDSLPLAQWDVVVVADPGADPAGRLAAAVGACRPGGLLVARAAPSLPAPQGTRRLPSGAGVGRRWLVARRV